MKRDSFLINSDELGNGMKEIQECWERFISNITQLYNKKAGKNIQVNYTVNAVALKECVKRVHQRRDYFRRYHNGMEMSEYKEIGLNMFWLMKLHPFDITGDDYEDIVAFNINEDFAMFYMLSALKKLAEELRKQHNKYIQNGRIQLIYDTERLSEDLYDEILYSLCFRDVSKEALGIIVELVANIVVPDISKIKFLD